MTTEVLKERGSIDPVSPLKSGGWRRQPGSICTRFVCGNYTYSDNRQACLRRRNPPADADSLVVFDDNSTEMQPLHHDGTFKVLRENANSSQSTDFGR